MCYLRSFILIPSNSNYFHKLWFLTIDTSILFLWIDGTEFALWFGDKKSSAPRFGEENDFILFVSKFMVIYYISEQLFVSFVDFCQQYVVNCSFCVIGLYKWLLHHLPLLSKLLPRTCIYKSYTLRYLYCM